MLFLVRSSPGRTSGQSIHRSHETRPHLLVSTSSPDSRQSTQVHKADDSIASRTPCTNSPSTPFSGKQSPDIIVTDSNQTLPSAYRTSRITHANSNVFISPTKHHQSRPPSPMLLHNAPSTGISGEKPRTKIRKEQNTRTIPPASPSAYPASASASRGRGASEMRWGEVGCGVFSSSPALHRLAGRRSRSVWSGFVLFPVHLGWGQIAFVVLVFAWIG